jgi:small subunit ribosomal protein S6
MTEETTTSRKYELMFILSPMLTEDKRKSVVGELESLLSSNGGEVVYKDDWGKRELAYRIKKYEEGYYMLYLFTLSNPEFLTEFDEHMRLDQNIIRHLVIKRDADYEVIDYEKLMEETQASQSRNDEKEKAKKEAPKKPAKKAEKSEELDKKLDKVESDSDTEI